MTIAVVGDPLMESYHRAAVELRKASSVVVCAHVKPDGDGIGSVLALTLGLKAAGIPAIPTLADDSDPPGTYEFLPGFGLFVAPGDLEAPDVFVALDTPHLDRLGAAAHLAEAARIVIVIDHHPDNTMFGTVNLVNAESAAVGLMVWQLLETLDVAPTPEIATCCWVALVTDTGRFAYGNTSPEALRGGAAMLEAGANPAEVHRVLYESRTAAALALDARVLGRLTVANGGRVAYAWVGDEDYAQTGAAPFETEHLVDLVRALQGVDVAVLVRVHSGSVRVNLRSKDGFDVGAVARSRGGGGHRAASGYTVESGLDAVITDLLPDLPGGERV